MTRGITDCGVAIGAAAALALAVWRVSHGLMSIEALLIVLMAGTEVFRPLRDLRTVLHQGMVGQSAAAGINALLAAEPLVPEQPPEPAGDRAGRSSRPSLSRMSISPIPAGAAPRMTGSPSPSPPARRSASSGRAAPANPRSRGCCCASSTRSAARCGSAATICRTLDPEALRRMIAVVHQDTYLFHGTVEENLRLGKPDADREELEAAARDANAHEFISAIAAGLRTR